MSPDTHDSEETHTSLEAWITATLHLNKAVTYARRWHKQLKSHISGTFMDWGIHYLKMEFKRKYSEKCFLSIQWKSVRSKTTLDHNVFHMDKNSQNILQIFFCVSQEKEGHDNRILVSGWTIPFNNLSNIPEVTLQLISWLGRSQSL